MNKKKAILLLVLVLALVGGGSAGAYYYIDSSKYISTDDAKVGADLRSIGSLAAGKLMEWNYKEGDSFRRGDVLGIVETVPARGTTAAVTQDILAPEDGTVIQSSAVKNQTVAPGAALAMSANLNQLYVTANIKETEITDVRVGSRVSLTVDAFAGVEFVGRVERIGLGTNSSFSMIPASNASGNFTKVIQRIPVKIALDSYQGQRLIPGLNALVKIER